MLDGTSLLYSTTWFIFIRFVQLSFFLCSLSPSYLSSFPFFSSFFFSYGFPSPPLFFSPASQSLWPSIHNSELTLSKTIAFPVETSPCRFHLLLATIVIVSLSVFIKLQNVMMLHLFVHDNTLPNHLS